MRVLANFMLLMSCAILLAVSALAQPNPVNVTLTSQKPGSLLVFPLYTSKQANPVVQDTRWVITNVSQSEEAVVHMFMIDRITCEQMDMFFCIPARCSEVFVASEQDPDVTGFILALAVDKDTGVPIQQNQLIGNAFVKAPAGSFITLGGAVEGNYAAESFRALKPNPGVVLPGDTTAILNLDGDAYDPVGRWLATPVQLPANAPGQTLVTIGLQGSVTEARITGAGQSGVGLAYNGNERAGSFSRLLSGECFATTMLTDLNPRVIGQFVRLLQQGGNVGTLKFPILSGVGLLITPQNRNGWAGITPLTKVTTINASLDVPILIPDC